jgi:[acyl-carrier-protein] S-malonyltransferase
MARETALVVCPGRGVYNKDELGYLRRHHADKADLVAPMDAARRAAGQTPVSELDGAERYSVATHTRGDNASALIHACAVADFKSIDRDRYEIVAVTGNSMGWYIALACGGALDAMGGFTVVNTMGTLMQEALIGGQMIYPFVDEDWRADPARKAMLLDLVDRIPDLYLSIELGGMLVLAGSAEALAAAEARLPPSQGRYPMRLANHAAFHTPLQAPVAAAGRKALPEELFRAPTLPLIDGRGVVWERHSSAPAALRDYTLGHQVVETYDFAAAIRTGIRELAPDRIILLGPGATLGGAVAQTLIAERWKGMTSKAEFQARQAEDPILLSMGLEEQRRRVL